MTRPRLYTIEAVVLKQSPVGEADRIFVLYTPDHGKLHAVARGVRRPRSKLGGHLEVLNHVRLSIAQGHSLDVVTQADNIGSLRRLRENLEGLSQALYVADLVNSFTAEGLPNYPVYQLLLKGLGWLEESRQPHLFLRYFELRLLHYSGYRPELFWCVQCRTQLRPGDHLFSSSLGGIICPDCTAPSEAPLIPVTVNALKILRFLQREEYPKAVRVKVQPAPAREAEMLLRSYIVYLLEREVKSASFLSLVAAVPTLPRLSSKDA